MKQYRYDDLIARIKTYGKTTELLGGYTESATLMEAADAISNMQNILILFADQTPMVGDKAAKNQEWMTKVSKTIVSLIKT